MRCATLCADSDQEQRIRFVDALFEVLTCTNAETLTDLKDGGFRTAYSMLKTVRSLDPDTRQALSGTLGLLVRSGAKSVSQSQPIQRLKNWRLVDWISKSSPTATKHNPPPQWTNLK